MIESGLRRAVAASSAQAGDGDWIRNSFPSILKSVLFGSSSSHQQLCPRKCRSLLFGGIPSVLLRALSLSKGSPPNKKVLSLRTLRLRDENAILDRHGCSASSSSFLPRF